MTLLTVILTTPCVSDAYEGETALNSGDTAATIKVLSPLAKLDDTSAQFELGKGITQVKASQTLGKP
mgnify:CR=1 FL=1